MKKDSKKTELIGANETKAKDEQRLAEYMEALRTAANEAIPPLKSLHELLERIVAEIPEQSKPASKPPTVKPPAKAETAKPVKSVKSKKLASPKK